MMRIQWRFASVILGAVFCVSLWKLIKFRGGRLTTSEWHHHHSDNFYMEPFEEYEQQLEQQTVLQQLPTPPPQRPVTLHSSVRPCTMHTCFDLSRCAKGFKVYLYPDESSPADFEKGKKRPLYPKLLRAIRQSRFYTDDPREACLFVPNVDTLDRDRLSGDYVKALPRRIKRLPHWQDGRNHLIFNLFSGTWPDYGDKYDFDTGQAIIAKASFRESFYRPGFDISLPLFHKDYPEKAHKSSSLRASGALYPTYRKYLLTFKGKRYLHGIGSETRNILRRLHNNKDIILLTTCRHGKNWQKFADRNCNYDNALYDKYDYKELLENSTFCLVPRGRRLGSFRFIEAMKAACVPVSLSNGWVLPFSEVLDWQRAIVQVDERMVLQLPSILKRYNHDAILAMRQQVHFIADTYFSSLEKIVSTTLEIIHDRVLSHLQRSYAMWNSPPGGLVSLPTFSQSLHRYPFYSSLLQSQLSPNYTAIIVAKSQLRSSSPLFRLMRQLAQTPTLQKVIIVWTSSNPPPKKKRWAKLNIDILVLVDLKAKGSLARFINHELVTTDAVLALNEDSRVVSDEVMFALSVWKDFPERLVGFVTRSHRWDKAKSKWSYESRPGNEYSMVRLNIAFYHRYYNHLFSVFLPKSLHHKLHQSPNCTDIAFNFLLSYVTNQPPIRVGQKFSILETRGQTGSKTPADDETIPEEPGSAKFKEQQACLDMLTEHFGDMPLEHSQVRLDPLLYKDNVSVMRKKYIRLGLRAP